MKEFGAIFVHAAQLLLLFQALLEGLLTRLHTRTMYEHAVYKGLSLCMAELFRLFIRASGHSLYGYPAT